MNISVTAPEVASFSVQERMFSNVARIPQEKRRKKYLAILLLSLDAGLRPVEVSRLETGDVDFHSGEYGKLHIRSAKQRKNKSGEVREKIRKIPLTRRLRDALAEHFREIKPKSQYCILFKSESEQSESEYMNRVTVWRIIKKLSDGITNPKTLRHTFATKIVQKNDIRTAQYLMGHNSQQTTEIYAHVNPERVESAIRSIDRRNVFHRIKDWFSHERPISTLAFTKGEMSRFHVGRGREIKLLEQAGRKKVNVVLLGAQGTGKTHLLDNYKTGKIIRIDDLRHVKAALQGILIYLFDGDKEDLALALSGKTEQVVDESGNMKEVWDRRILLDTIKNLTDLIVKVTKKNEYTLIVDDVERIGYSAVSTLEFLRNHFHMIVAARRIPVSKATFLTNFDRIHIKPLSRPETMELIELAAKDLRPRIEDYDMFCNKIWDNCRGVPQFTLEYIDRMRKESGKIDYRLISATNHSAARPEIDMTVGFLIIISSFMALRYLGRETDDRDAYLFIGGIFMIFALFARTFLNKGRRKYI